MIPIRFQWKLFIKKIYCAVDLQFVKQTLWSPNRVTAHRFDPHERRWWTDVADKWSNKWPCFPVAEEERRVCFGYTLKTIAYTFEPIWLTNCPIQVIAFDWTSFERCWMHGVCSSVCSQVENLHQTVSKEAFQSLIFLMNILLEG